MGELNKVQKEPVVLHEQTQAGSSPECEDPGR